VSAPFRFCRQVFGERIDGERVLALLAEGHSICREAYIWAAVGPDKERLARLGQKLVVGQAPRDWQEYWRRSPAPGRPRCSASRKLCRPAWGPTTAALEPDGYRITRNRGHLITLTDHAGSTTQASCIFQPDLCMSIRRRVDLCVSRRVLALRSRQAPLGGSSP
jgi:hypothetical protein